MKFYHLELEAPAEYGERTIINREKSIWKFDQIHLIFVLKPTNQIINAISEYFVTKRVYNKLIEHNISGINGIEEIEQEYFGEDLSTSLVYEFYKLGIDGKCYQSDISIDESYLLIISERALSTLREFLIGDYVLTEGSLQ